MIFALVLLLGLGLALVLPWLVSSQIHAAQNEADEKINAPKTARYYVSKDGDGSDPNAGWSTAAKNLQDALALAKITGGGEIWVAAGVYHPDKGTGQIENAVTSTFTLSNNLKIYGGFDTGDTQLSERDWVSNVTVLSGDIDNNDIKDINGVVVDTSKIKGSNAYHVVTAKGVTGTAVLDGLTITAGNANDFDNDDYSGGGLYCYGYGSGNTCSPSLRNVTFSGNLATYGGAMFVLSSYGNSSPSLMDVTFSGNAAGDAGGAMANWGYAGNNNPRLRNVTFSGNSAGGEGGAIFNYGHENGNSSPILNGVTFTGNSASEGGAMYNDGDIGTSNPSLVNVTFSGNSADNKGGAMYNYGFGGTSSPSLRDVTFSGNWADFGGAIYNDGSGIGISSPSLTNVVFSGNSADTLGGAMYNEGKDGTSSPSLINVTFSGNTAGLFGGAMFNNGVLGTSSPKVRNSILWNNQDASGIGTISATIYNNDATTTLTHSLAQGTGDSSNWTPDPSYVDIGGNIGADPMFVTPIDPSTAPTTTGNLRLQSGSPAIDVGDNTFVTEVHSDLDGGPRIIDGNLDGTPTVDIGAYETPIDYPYDSYLPLINR